MKKCLGCNKAFTRKHQVKYCSNKCQADLRYKEWILRWKRKDESGGIGLSVRGVSGHLKRYLWEKFDGKCSQCYWDKRNPETKKVPLEIDHIDGNAENNKEENLRLLCPNCHALTSCYKNLNKGNGRKWRMKKYIKNSQ